MDESLKQGIRQQIEHIGDTPDRQGLKDTPSRILRAWREIYSGYSQNPETLFTTFDCDGYDQIVLLKDIEVFSMCEHHMLPFFGKAHVAYLPNDKVVGVSKLARLVDMYAHRLQIQERIGEQVTQALMDYLHPKGAACVIEACHLCMRMRGVAKQHSIMVTSSLKGVFLEDVATKAEFMQLIRG